MNYIKKHFCRFCGDFDLKDIINLGTQYIQGAFLTPKKNNPPTRKVPNIITRCESCNLVQNLYSVDPDILYSSYFYRSGISQTMKNHLEEIAFEGVFALDGMLRKKNVCDISCNDLTLLSHYPKKYLKVGIDPSDITYEASLKEENKDIKVINSCFPSNFAIEKLKQILINDKFDLISGISFFYDVNDPLEFLKWIKYFLADNGLWICEFAYLPLVLDRLSYDGCVNEHVCLYSFQTYNQLLEKCGLKAVKVQVNDTNGGSLQVWATHANCTYYDKREWYDEIVKLKVDEFNKELDNPTTYSNFAERVKNHKVKLVNVLKELNSKGEIIHCLGMSTKLNNILGFCEIGPDLIGFASERDPEKHGGRTLSGIEMLTEEESRKMATTYLVGPYFFKDELVSREKAFLDSGGKLLFPLPEIVLVDKNGETKL